jgi:hypothetical protein
MFGCGSSRQSGVVVARVGVLGNCDTAGMANALRVLMPDRQIVPLTLPSDAAQRTQWLADLPHQADLVLVNNTVFKGGLRPMLEPHLSLIRRYPTSHFSAFHPDCCYVGLKASNKLISPAYNSALCVAGFVRGLSQEQVLGLFRGEVFEAVGYYNGWEPSVKKMQEEFTESSMEFRPYYLKVKRLGTFMHSINHPKIETLITMARMVAMELGASSSVLEMPVAMADGLAGLDWPLYPEIGEFYGVRGRYLWKIDGEVLGLEAFVARSFARYAELGLTADSIFFSHPSFHERFSALLNERGIGNG